MSSRKNKSKKIKNHKKAIQILYAGGFWSIVALVILTSKGGLTSFNEATAHVGDTIGGILGPSLNFVGLIVLYYSLKEQYNANQEQRKSLRKEKKRARRNGAFETALKLVDEIRSYWEANNERFSDLLQEEDKLRFQPPGSFIYSIAEEDDEGYFWNLNKDCTTPQKLDSLDGGC